MAANGSAGLKIFHLFLIKPSHYDDDGYVIQWLRSAIPSNTLAALNGLVMDCIDRKVLGEDADHFRLEPVGGRLAGVKKIPYWFVASAFDRQGKILEEICELLEETISEMEMLKGSVDMEHVPSTGRGEPRRRQDPGSAT